MKKCKIAVYAISKNEEKYVKKWVNSMREADVIYVLDTGSNDETVKLLKEEGAIVQTKTFNPWRFDVARNESLAMVDEDVDICVCTDLDEVLLPGWRAELEKVFFSDHPTRYRYNYNWKLNAKDEPLVSFRLDNIHARTGYHWTHPVHEVLSYEKEETYGETNITLNHYPDPNKSRSSYLPLLELSVKEDPSDDRNLHYLGREYMFYQQYDKCIETLHHHLKCPKATWKDERCASMRFIARSYYAKNYLEETEFWYQKAIFEAPYLREPYLELASFYENQYSKAYENIKKALQIKEKSNSYINEEFAWNDSVYDILSLAAFYTGHYEEAITAIKEAIKLNPENSRYHQNYELMLPYSITSSHE